MQRRGQIGGAIQIMHLPIGQRHDPGNPAIGFFGQCLGQFAEQQGATVIGTVAHRDPAHLGPRTGAQLRLQRIGGSRHLRGSIRQPLTGRSIHQHQHDIRQCPAFFGPQGWAGQGRQHHQPGQTAPDPARQTAPQRQPGHHQNQPGQSPPDNPGQKRIKDNRTHCPNLSSSAGTWT